MVLELSSEFGSAMQAIFTKAGSVDATAIFTFALVIVGLIQLGLFYRQLWLIRESLKDAKEAAEAGTLAANAANRQAKVAEESLTKLERPYLFVFNLSALDVEEIEDAEGDTVWLTVTYSVANYGKIPAIIKYAQAGLIVSTEPKSPPQLGNHHGLVVSPVLPANDLRAGIESSIAWLGETYNDEDNNLFPKLGNNTLFFWVIITYRGPFSDQHETRMCWEYDQETNRFIGPYGGPEYSGEK